MTRPVVVVAVLGTGTEVGKTWVTAQLAVALGAQGLHIQARKPAQSFAPEDAAGNTTDRDVLASATGEAPDQVCPPQRCYPTPMAPPMAADSLGRESILVSELVDEIVWGEGVDVGFVETAGGAASPLAHDATSAELALRLAPDLTLLIADAGLGTIHAVTASLAVIGTDPIVVVLNRFDPDDELHRRNEAWLSDHGVVCVTELGAIMHHIAVIS